MLENARRCEKTRILAQYDYASQLVKKDLLEDALKEMKDIKKTLKESVRRQPGEENAVHPLPLKKRIAKTYLTMSSSLPSIPFSSPTVLTSWRLKSVPASIFSWLIESAVWQMKSSVTFYLFFQPNKLWQAVFSPSAGSFYDVEFPHLISTGRY
ncbi:hypothetical protein V8G54_013026 [Vigna mungo]|uniref:Uncharacterized protein n=1 Tax=Vigna mungo TaxID=3915 RepID=A0AAQ3NUA6_VIGMU